MTELPLSLLGGAKRTTAPSWPVAGRKIPVAAVGLFIAAVAVVCGVALGLRLQTAGLVLLVGGLAALRAQDEARRTCECRPLAFVSRHVAALGLLAFVLVLAAHWATLAGLLGTSEPSAMLTGVAVQVGVLGIGSLAIAAVSARVHGARRVLVVGGADTVGRAARLVAAGGCDVVGVGLVGAVEEADSVDLGVPTCVVASLERLAQIAVEWGAETVAVAPSPELGPRAMRRLSWFLSDDNVGLAVLGLPEGVSRRRISASRLGAATAIEVDGPGPSTLDRAGKVIVDRIGASLLLLVSLPVLAVCALLIRLDSRGAAFFRQTRVGRDGSTFTMYKLRSMVADAESVKATLADQDEGNGRLFKMRRDPRITRVGAVMRKTSLDELPQLFNVIKGEMSLVGPRPALPCEVVEYDEEERHRLAVRPGLTGLWQVSGRSDLSHDESVRLDLEYTDNWDLGEDLRIGLKTFSAVARSKGAY